MIKKSLFVLVLICSFVFLTGCNKELSPNGEIEGYTYEEILKYYYQDINLAKVNV